MCATAGARRHRARGGVLWWRLLRRRAAGRAVAALRVVRGCAAAAGFARQLAAAGLSPGCLGPVRSWAWALGREILSAQVHPCGTARSAQPRSMRARTVCRQNLKILFVKKKTEVTVAAQISPSMMT